MERTKQKSLAPAESRYFVSNTIVEKMFDNIMIDYRAEFKKVQIVVEKHHEHLRKLQRVVVEQTLPGMNETMENLGCQTFKLS